MASHINGLFPKNLQNSINSRKLLVVGAGGIGCELLKNLVLTGFQDIQVIDLDTIDVSNLNRQFLFHKQHVGKSKSKVASESAKQFNPNANITAHHDSIITPDYGVTFYKKFDLVLNALDNKTARNHVNRMCLAAAVPLIESGTAGYLGQVTVIEKGVTECYECQPKPAQKTYPGCTIRNTPSEPIHCIVWAKHLFNQLFGEADADEDVSPDSADPELSGDAGKTAVESNNKGNVERVSTRLWAQSHNYNPEKLFNKLFNEDIQYLLSMDKLWQKRRAPTPLDWFSIPSSPENAPVDSSLIKDQRPWTLSDCYRAFMDSINSLKMDLQMLKQDDHLVWDKDDEQAMDFVTACANIRAFIFGIAQKTRFDVKSMAGNIIPAIATTNAVIAGIIVLQAMKILNKESDQCRTVYMNRKANPKKRLLVPCLLDKPNPKCYVCAEKPEVSVQLNVERTTVKSLEDKILKSALNMVAPDVEIMDGKGTILLSSEPGETDCNNDKFLIDFNILDGCRLSCDDFLQDFNLCVTILHCEKMEDGVEFNVVGDPDKLKAEQEEMARKKEQNGSVSQNSGQISTASTFIDDEDDIECLSDFNSKKRKMEDSEDVPTKKLKTDDISSDYIVV